MHKVCVDVCPTDAINLDAKETVQEPNVGGIVYTPGVEPYYSLLH